MRLLISVLTAVSLFFTVSVNAKELSFDDFVFLVEGNTLETEYFVLYYYRENGLLKSIYKTRERDPDLGRPAELHAVMSENTMAGNNICYTFPCNQADNGREKWCKGKVEDVSCDAYYFNDGKIEFLSKSGKLSQLTIREGNQVAELTPKAKPEPKKKSLLSGYDTRKPSHSMRCDTRQTGWKKYEILGDDLVVDGVHKVPILEREGKVFAAKTENKYSSTELVIIADYSKKQITQKSSIGGHARTEVFDCL